MEPYYRRMETDLKLEPCLTINVPVVYMALYGVILRRVNPNPPLKSPKNLMDLSPLKVQSHEIRKII